MSQHTIWVVDLFLWLFALMLMRSREVHIYQVLGVALAGFMLAMTPLGWPVTAFLKVLLSPLG